MSTKHGRQPARDTSGKLLPTKTPKQRKNQAQRRARKIRRRSGG